MFLEYKIKLETSMLLPSYADLGGVVVIPASELKGMTRYSFQQILSMGEEEERLLFGSVDNSGKISFEDVVYHGETKLTTAINISTNGDWENMNSYPTIPSGAELHGKVHITPDITIRQVNIIRHSIFLLSLTRLGMGKTRGYGKCSVEFPDLEGAGMVFISYSWEDENHNEWVLNLADHLARSGIGIIFDKYDTDFGDNFHVFMEDGIAKAQKALLIFTPTFKEKALSRKGGVGYEYSLINAELYDMLAKNHKFLPVLRKGDVNTSIPPIYKQYLFCDMRDDSLFDKSFKDLYFSILGKKQVVRPTPPWSKPSM